MCVDDSVATLYGDLNLKIDRWQSWASWAELKVGKREDVVLGAPIIVTDEDVAYLATVTQITDIGPYFAVHWDRQVSLPYEPRSAVVG